MRWLCNIKAKEFPRGERVPLVPHVLPVQNAGKDVQMHIEGVDPVFPGVYAGADEQNVRNLFLGGLFNELYIAVNQFVLSAA